MKFPRLTDYDLVAYDTETTGLLWWKDRIFGVSISVADRDWYWDIRKTPEAVEWLREEIPRVKRLCAHNAKFDWHMSRELGIRFPEGRVDCTMIRAALIDEHLVSYDLDYLGKKYLGAGKDTDIYARLADLFGGKPTKHAQAPNLQRAPTNLVGPYACRDTRVCYDLCRWQDREIATQDLGQVENLEKRLLPCIVRMEEGGVRVNTPQADKAVVELGRKIETGQRQLNSLAGFPVNVNPSGSIHQLFEPKEQRDAAGNKTFVLNDGTIAEPTESGGKACLDANCLRRMKHPAAAMILSLRKMVKAKDTFLSGHVLSNHHNGIIHANFNQTKSDNDAGTGTGRLSVNSPALQQIPARDKDMAAIVRAVFVPDIGGEWVCNDWAQMDFRVFAHYVNDREIIERYAADPNTDFHALAASLTGLPRSPRFAGDPNAKQINLGLVFGMGKGRLAQEMGLPFTIEPNNRGGTWIKPGPEAEAVFDKYHGAIPGIGALLSNASSVAKSRGFVRTVAGRKIRFPKGMFTHKAGGLIFQGSAADALKIKIVELDSYIQSIRGTGARFLLNVHDEFDFSIPPDRADIRGEISKIVTAFGPSNEVSFRVPIVTDQGIGSNWYEASK